MHINKNPFKTSSRLKTWTKSCDERLWATAGTKSQRKFLSFQ